MIWVGLTGGMGCGKSTALNLFKELGCGVESADKIVSELYENNAVLEEISKTLGLKPTKDLGNLKSQIAKTVFNNKENLKKLELILHPKVRIKASESKKLLEEKGFSVSFYEIPLLFEKNLESEFDKTVCVGATLEIQIQRIKLRNPNWTEEEIKNRLNAQMSLIEKKERSDFYIDNSGDLKNLKNKCNDLLNKLTGV